MLRRTRGHEGQTMVELALVLPLFVVLLAGIISFGLAVFYQQQLDNAVREAARYAAIHSATHLQCPTVANVDPQGGNKPLTYRRCDTPEAGWQFMSNHARASVFGLDRSDLRLSACWSGYQQGGAYDALPAVDDDGDPSTPPVPNPFVQCTMPGDTNNDGVLENVDPSVQTDSLPCPPAPTTASNDTGSDIPSNNVTIYGCYVWRPALGGMAIPVPCPNGWCSIEVIPSTVVMRAVLTEVIHRQQ